MTQGERVKEIRKTLDLTLEKFGEKLGVKKGALSSIENGRNALTDQLAKSICREYNVNYDFLMYGEGDMFDDLPQTIIDEMCVTYGLDDFDQFLIELYVSLPPETHAAIKEQAMKMLKDRGFRKEED